MFTGLILELGEVVSVQKKGGSSTLSLKADKAASDTGIGDSIAVNGVCLTVVGKNKNILSFDISNETLGSTNLGTLKSRERINLEASLSPNSKIGGHFVTGHIDATGTIRSKTNFGDMLKFEIAVPKNVMRFIVEKGSIALDGVSLTVVDLLKDGLTVVIIPHTAELTTFGFKNVGDTLNVEADILGKYVAKFLEKDVNSDAGLMSALTKGGFTA
ncbi:MAG: riboflavin synthase [Nitrospiraceae bacterium]|nr:riboflavin synthase [Nitrospiraceae bacterium]